MKRICLFAILVALFSSCDSITESIIEKSVKIANEENSKEPAELGEGLTLAEIAYDGNNIIYKIKVEPNKSKIMDKQEDEIKKNVVKDLKEKKENDEGMRNLFYSLRNLAIEQKKNKGIKYIYYSSSSFQEKTISIDLELIL